MKATTGFRALAGAGVLLLALSAVSTGQLTGRLELSSPNYDLFTPTDWIDAASFTLKERIPAGITGFIYTNQAANVWLQGVVLKQTSRDPRPVELARFYSPASRPLRVSQQVGTRYQYSIALGSLANNPDIDMSYVENKVEVDKLKDQIQTGIASITGKFIIRVYLRSVFTDRTVDGGSFLDFYERTFDIPFATADQAKIQVQVNPLVSTPSPTITVFLPPERPTLEYEIAVYRVQDNPRDAVRGGVAVWRERITNGRTVLVYPPTATPLTSGSRYVIAGRSFYQSSSSRAKLSIDADLVEFRYEDPSRSVGGIQQPTSSPPGQDANRPDPLVTLFGTSATQVPPGIAQQLSQLLRGLENRGWTFSQFRYNNRVITQADLANLLSQFQDATVSVKE